MRPSERGARRRDRAVAAAMRSLLAAGASFSLGAVAVAAEPAPYRARAPIVVDAPAPFVQLALPPAAYGHAEQDELRDLRIVDARGEPVPFAVLPARSTVQSSEQVREATLYPLPSRPSSTGTWPSPVDVVVDGDRISVRRHGEATVAARAADSAGWLIDTGEVRPGEPRPRSLRLRWSGPAEFSVAYRLETSDDLRAWRSAAGGQLMALQSPAGALTQPVVALGDDAGRFVRLVWLEPSSAPALSGATVVVASTQAVAVASASELSVAPSSTPASATSADPAARRALEFDLGGALPLIDVDLRFAAGTHVAPARLQGRARVDQPWRDLGSGVFYRLERAGDVSASPAIALPTTTALRFVRVVPDERAGTIDRAAVRLVVHASLASLVFATQGEPPFRLLAGSADAPPAALPIAMVVPQLESERARFGHASLGPFTPDVAAAQAADAAARQARMRPWLLWAVLLIGAGALGALVWRLARAGPAPPAAP